MDKMRKKVKKENSFLFILFLGLADVTRNIKEGICDHLEELWFLDMIIIGLGTGCLGILYVTGDLQAMLKELPIAVPILVAFFTPIVICLVLSIFIAAYKQGVEKIVWESYEK